MSWSVVRRASVRILMFGMKGIYLSASGAKQGHHGPLVFYTITKAKQEGHDGPVSLYWLTCKFPSYQTLKYLGTVFKHKTLRKD